MKTKHLPWSPCQGENISHLSWSPCQGENISHLKRYFLRIAITAFLVFLTGNAFAAKNASRDFLDGDGEYANDWIVTSPYWQVDSGSYTFIAISHNSLSGMASQIGITIIIRI